MVGSERFGNLASAVDPDTEAVHPSAGPMVIVLGGYVGVLALGEGVQRCFDDGGVALVEQPRVPVMGVDDAPVVCIGQVVSSVPSERIEVLPSSQPQLWPQLPSPFRQVAWFVPCLITFVCLTLKPVSFGRQHRRYHRAKSGSSPYSRSQMASYRQSVGDLARQSEFHSRCLVGCVVHEVTGGR